MRTNLFVLITAVLLAGCGRTTLDDFSDGGIPPRVDGGRVDSGPACRSDRECDDGAFCNGEERCSAGRCVAGTAPACDDGIECTRDDCDEGARGCQSVPNHDRCGPESLCTPDGCSVIRCDRDRDCRDEFECNGREDCRRGTCRAGAAPRCEDGVGCTTDLCLESAGGCVNRPDDRLCDDGAFCTGVEFCEPGFGCFAEEPVFCEDGDPCTEDFCDEASRSCVSIPIPDPACGGFCPDVPIGPIFGPEVFRGSTRGLSDDLSGSCGGERAPEMTFEWTAPFDAFWSFDTFGSSYDTVLYLQEFCGGPELPGACNDDAVDVASQVGVFLPGGVPVIIVVDGFRGSSGDFVLNIFPEMGGFEICNDGVDNDGDGRFDCMDPDCFADPFCTGMCLPFERNCRNGIDEDCDMLFDCEDPDCFMRPVCGMMCAPFEFSCNNFFDDDCDGLMDCADPDCMGRPECGMMCAPFEFSCNNFLDDDCDGLMDCADPECIGRPECGMMCEPEERTISACGDGIDNDCNGAPDCADPQCSPFGPGAECCNGFDDTGDGQIDIFTCLCDTDAECAGVGTLEQVCWSTLFGVCAPRCNFFGGDMFCQGIDPGLRCRARDGECVPL